MAEASARPGRTTHDSSDTGHNDSALDEAKLRVPLSKLFVSKPRHWASIAEVALQYDAYISLFDAVSDARGGAVPPFVCVSVRKANLTFQGCIVAVLAQTESSSFLLDKRVAGLMGCTNAHTLVMASALRHLDGILRIHAVRFISIPSETCMYACALAGLQFTSAMQSSRKVIVRTLPADVQMLLDMGFQDRLDRANAVVCGSGITSAARARHTDSFAGSTVGAAAGGGVPTTARGSGGGGGRDRDRSRHSSRSRSLSADSDADSLDEERDKARSRHRRGHKRKHGDSQDRHRRGAGEDRDSDSDCKEDANDDGGEVLNTMLEAFRVVERSDNWRDRKTCIDNPDCLWVTITEPDPTLKLNRQERSTYWKREKDRVMSAWDHMRTTTDRRVVICYVPGAELSEQAQNLVVVTLKKMQRRTRLVKERNLSVLYLKDASGVFGRLLVCVQKPQSKTN